MKASQRQKYRIQNAAHQRAKAQARGILGLCRGCGKVHVDKGVYRCATCLEQIRDAKVRRSWVRGLCLRCPRPAVPRRQHCLAHALMHRVASRDWRLRHPTYVAAREITVSDAQWYRLTGEQR